MKWTRHILAALAVSIMIAAGVVAPARAAEIAPPNNDVARILQDTNAARAANGLPPLILDGSMTTVARNWSATQARERRMYHNPQYSSQIPAGWSRAGENVASGYAPAAVVKGWMNSPGHRANILGDFTTIGIGYVDGYATQVFAKYPVTAPTPTVVPKDFTVRSHVANKGWIAGGGTTGQGLGLEAIAVRQQQAGRTICLQAHVQNVGWMTPVCTTGSGTEAVVGTTGRSLRMEALRIWSPNNIVSGRGHVSNIGWQGRVVSTKAGAQISIGTTGRSLQLEFAELFK
ncbi:CAP domain-containing protein [Microbacterium sp. 1.5R]|uniref:CAP domain-containing protein n=1 Tax=Microbacterium sp. 1.5R TaxID=1916917 RepID=UPI0011A534EC|nr:CAP domain-containing protein [Microbacterium sp. 1.5R]